MSAYEERLERAIENRYAFLHRRLSMPCWQGLTPSCMLATSVAKALTHMVGLCSLKSAAAALGLNLLARPGHVLTRRKMNVHILPADILQRLNQIAPTLAVRSAAPTALQA